MSSFQKTIKYIAIAFAIFLAIVIIAGIANLAIAIVTGVTGGMDLRSEKEAIDVQNTFTDVSSLDITNNTGKLFIKTGSEFKVEAENVSENFVARVRNDGTLEVNDDESGFNFLWFTFHGFHNPNSKVTVYLPEDFVAEEAVIESGAGSITLEGLHSDYFELSAGAGTVNGDNLSSKDTQIDGGVGTISLKNVNFHDAEISCGVGTFEIEGSLTGDSSIECGVGGVKLDLVGNTEDYDLDIETGVGTIRLNGEKISNEYSRENDAPNSIAVEGGVGDVYINIED